MQVSRCKNLTPDVTKFVLLELRDISLLSVPYTRVCCSTHGKFQFAKHKMLELILKFYSLQHSIVRTATEP